MSKFWSPALLFVSVANKSVLGLGFMMAFCNGFSVPWVCLAGKQRIANGCSPKWGPSIVAVSCNVACFSLLHVQARLQPHHGNCSSLSSSIFCGLQGPSTSRIVLFLLQ